MADLWLLIPSRGRPESVDRLVRACALTCTGDTRLHFGFDEDDPCLQANIRAAGYSRYTVKPRMGLTAWTNHLARRHLSDPRGIGSRALGSIGDDMVPVTAGWDELLLGSLPPGGGFAYPNDSRRDDVPEMCVISTGIVKALGWMACPNLDHWYIDNVWADLGRAAGCLVYCPHVIVHHLHPNVTGQPGDQTYTDAARTFDMDLAAYQWWRMRDMPTAVKAVCQARDEVMAG